MLLAGLVVGRWWSIPFLALLWTGVIAATVDQATAGDLVAATGLGAANAAVGVAVHRLLRAAIARVRHRKS
jgi:hypothetical protein